MKILSVASVLLFVILTGCSSAKKSTATRYEGKAFDQFFIIASTADLEARVRLEKEFALGAEARQLKVIKSIDVMPPSLSDPKPPTKEELVNKVKASGCEAFMVIYYVKNNDSTKYIPGEQFKGTDGGLGQLAIQLLAGNKNIATNNGSDQLTKDSYRSGYYSKGKGFYLLSVLFNSADEKIIYSNRSESFDDAQLVSFSHGYMVNLMKQLEAENLIKK